MIPVFRYVELCKEGNNKLFSVSTGNIERTNGFKLQQMKLKEDIRADFLAGTEVMYWHRLPGRLWNLHCQRFIRTG